MIQYSNDDYIIMGMSLIIYALIIFIVFLIFNKCYRYARSIDKFILFFILTLLISILCSFIYEKKLKGSTNNTFKNINNNLNDYYKYIFDYFYLKNINNEIEKEKKNLTINSNITNNTNDDNNYNNTLDDYKNNNYNDTKKENYINDISDTLDYISYFFIKLGKFINELFDKIYASLFKKNNKP
jgi:hypothetical protein